MKNHYHMLIETPDGNISLGMRQLNGVFTQTFNRRHNRVGHLFQGRYKAILLQKDSHLLEVCRYAVLNPVRAKIVEKPDQWRWSSYRATAGKGKTHPCLTTDWVLSQFSSKRYLAWREYRNFVKKGIGLKSIKEDVKAQSILGKDDFVNALKDYIKGHRDIADIPKSQRYLDRPKLNDLFTAKVINKQSLRNKMVVDAVNKYGYTQREIAACLGMHFSSISRIMREKGLMSTK